MPSERDLQIIENQKAIISIVLSLNESANIRENIFKLDMENFQDEKKAWLSEKADLQKQVDSLPQIEKDMQKLKDSLEKQSRSLTVKNYIIGGLAISLGTSILLHLVK